MLKRVLTIVTITLVLAGCDFFDDSRLASESPFTGPEQRLPELDLHNIGALFDVADVAIDDHLSGKVSPPEPGNFAGVTNRIYVVLWHRGRKLGSWWTQGDNLAASVYRATQRVLTDANLRRAAGLEVHLQVLGPDQLLDAGYVHGLHGLSFRKQRVHNYYASYAVETNIKQRKLLQRLEDRLLNADSSDVELRRYYFPTRHASRAYRGDVITHYYMGSTPQLSLAVSLQSFQETRALAQKWLLNAVTESGQFRYLYYPSRDEFPLDRNNMIRQLMGSRALAELISEYPEAEALHRRNLSHMLQAWYHEAGDEAYILYRNKSKLGANAMALRTLVYSPLFDQYRSQAQRLLNGMLALQAPDGGFEPWYREPDYSYDRERLLYFYSGEALLALVEYYERTGDESVLAAARRGQAYYLRRYVDALEENYYPAYVPWHAQSLHALHRVTGEPHLIDAVFVMTDKLLETQNQNGEDNPYFLGRFYNPATPDFGSPHSSSDAVYTEGLAYAHELAVMRQDEARIERYREALILGIHNLQNLQYRDARMYFVKRPAAAEGALRIHVTDNKVRVDGTQHAFDAFAKIDALLDSGVLALPASGD